MVKEAFVASTFHATGPGRVNLIGDHTDYNSGVALPMAIGLSIDVSWTPGEGSEVIVTSEAYHDDAVHLTIPLDAEDFTRIEPGWARLIAAMIHLAGPVRPGRLDLTSTLPTGAGLSSSAALCVALAELFASPGPAHHIAHMCQEAEHLIGVPVGLMDPLVCAGGQAGHALLIDFFSGATHQVRLPPSVDVVIVDSGLRRDLRTAPYAARVAECRQAEHIVGVLGRASLSDLRAISEPLIHRRARHVVTECARVHGVAEALESDDLALAGSLLDEGHRSLSADFEVSTPALDALVADLRQRPGVHGARLTGAGFGGCVVLLTDKDALDPTALGRPAWVVEAVDGTMGRFES
jgi:galactokinase